MIRHSIRNRIIFGFCGFTLLICMVFSLFSLIFLYTVEDTFFDRMIAEEAAYVTEQYQQTGQLPTPRQEFIQLYSDLDAAPTEVQQLYQDNPGLPEYAGPEGRHYHLMLTGGDPAFLLVAEVSEHLVVRPMRTAMVKFLAVSVGILLVLAMLLGYLMARKTIRPLTQLAELVGSAGPEQLPAAFAADYPTNEIGVLARSLETAMLRIRTFIEREQHFTRDASHELRTPITIIKGAAELLAKSPLDAGDRQLLSRIEGAVGQMSQSVETLLTLAREEGASAAKAPVTVLPLVEQTVIQYADKLDENRLTLNIEVAAEATLRSTTGVLQILLANLLGNAFQYTRDGEVSIRVADNRLVISDSGGGIDDAIQDKVCEPLIKGGQSQGFGLGLSIVKRLCERHQMVLDIASSDHGTTVAIDFSQG